MGILINGIDTNIGRHYTLDQKYEFLPFPYSRYDLTMSSGEVVSFDVKDRISKAWPQVLQRAGGPHCNRYFMSLPAGKSLKDVLADGTIFVHYLSPKAGHTDNDMPGAATNGRHIALGLATLIPAAPNVLACTFIHGLAHVAGASIDKTGPRRLEAENALKHCFCASQFSEVNVGVRIVEKRTGYA